MPERSHANSTGCRRHAAELLRHARPGEARPPRLLVTLGKNWARRAASYWRLATGGVFSLFLAVVILILPHAAQPSVAGALGIYALAFGALLVVAAFSLRRSLPGR